MRPKAVPRTAALGLSAGPRVVSCRASMGASAVITWVLLRPLECPVAGLGDALGRQLVAPELRVDASVPEDERAISFGRHLLEVRRCEDDRGPRLGRVADDRMQLGAGVHVHAGGGVVQDQQRGAGAQRATADDLLLVPAAEGPKRAVDELRRADVEALDQRERGPAPKPDLARLPAGTSPLLPAPGHGEWTAERVRRLLRAVVGPL